MDLFEEPYWNFLQLLGWVYLGDRPFVRDASERNTEFGTYFSEEKLPDGQKHLVELPGKKRSLISLSVAAAMNGRTAAPSFEVAKGDILDALMEGKVVASAIRYGSAERTDVPAVEWCDLAIFEDERLGIYAGLKRPLSGQPRYIELRISRSQILKIWPDHLMDIAIREVNFNPPEHIGDDPLRAWLLHDSWTVLEAMYLLHGYVPRSSANWTDEIFTHFVQMHVYLMPALELGIIGKHVSRSGDYVWVDKPINWYRWALTKNAPIDVRVRAYFGDKPTQAGALQESRSLEPRNTPRVEWIKDEVQRMFGHAIQDKNLPRGAKKLLREAALKDRRLFCSEHVFDHAWGESGFKVDVRMRLPKQVT